jgi:ABC-type antimicrobial peptide transport system permease subunit
MALGALPRRVLKAVLRETLALAGLGIGCGLPWHWRQLLAGFLYGVKPGDATVLFASVSFLVLTAAIAGYIPARRAARIDPVVALRDE